MPEETLDRSSLERLVRALRQARVQKALSVEDISRLINIRETHIEKIEEGDFTFVPPLYVFSYLKKYAAELGIGDDALLEASRNELGIPVSRLSARPPAQAVTPGSQDAAPSSKSNGRKALVVAVAAATAILIGLAFLYLSGRL
ncbi:MAG: helix-turn-helix domain-containing protein [Chlorobaculum sp.]|nr:helix-turn-helix domain-containing protein [Chlorobaculum sp.]